MDKPKMPDLALIIAKGLTKKKTGSMKDEEMKEEEMSSEEDNSEDKSVLAEELLSAIKDGDVESFSSALESFINSCKY